MKKTKELLFEDYERLDEISKIMDAKSDQRNDIEEMKDKIRNELIKYDSIEMESESKKNELEAQNKWEKHKNWINVGGVLGGLLVTIWATYTSLEFDKEHTITSTVGRGMVNKGVSAFNDMLSKMFKHK